MCFIINVPISVEVKVLISIVSSVCSSHQCGCQCAHQHSIISVLISVDVKCGCQGAHQHVVSETHQRFARLGLSSAYQLMHMAQHCGSGLQ